MISASLVLAARSSAALWLVLLVPGCTVPNRTPPAPPRPRVTVDERANFANYQTLGIFLENQTGTRLSDGVMRELEDEFMRAVLERRFSLAARSDIERIVRELRLQRSGLTEDAAARVGRMLNIPGMIIVSITSISVGVRDRPLLAEASRTYYRTAIGISARLVDSERAQVLWISSYTSAWDHDSSDGPRDGLIGPTLRHVSRVVASGLPPRSTP